MKVGDMVYVTTTKDIGIIVEEPDSYCFVVLIGGEPEWVLQSKTRLVNENR